MTVRNRKRVSCIACSIRDRQIRNKGRGAEGRSCYLFLPSLLKISIHSLVVNLYHIKAAGYPKAQKIASAKVMAKIPGFSDRKEE